MVEPYLSGWFESIPVYLLRFRAQDALDEIKDLLCENDGAYRRNWLKVVICTVVSFALYNSSRRDKFLRVSIPSARGLKVGKPIDLEGLPNSRIGAVVGLKIRPSQDADLGT